MRPPSLALLALTPALVLASSPASSPQPLQQPSSLPAPLFTAQLKGRFLHLTDLHPDPLYTFNSSEATACHVHSKKDQQQVLEDAWAEGEDGRLRAWSGRRGEEDDRAGYWGTPVR